MSEFVHPAEHRHDFSRQAEIYRNYRPAPPSDFITYLASLAPNHDVAWDCGSGNGQVAQLLVPHFNQIEASDISLEQIEHAFQHERIRYFVAPAESSRLPSQSVDLLTIGSALHWFDFDRFYAEVNRILKPEGIIAAWCYNQFELTSELSSIFPVLQEYKQHIMKFVPTRGVWVQQHYQTIPFPFEEVEIPVFYMYKEWTLEDYVGFFKSVSGYQVLLDQGGETFLADLYHRLQVAWGNRVSYPFRWQIYARVGRVNSES